ncbi:MAG: tetratricopeptide repeat protein [Gammaproteobacteria bacterium]|nr:tetratricopeptide repeat protein [Gammaproteobacteria bacterium]MDH5584531.1 tetratricopeptide repeat protein [Gammaproteobacteria bacterium]
MTVGSNAWDQSKMDLASLWNEKNSQTLWLAGGWTLLFIVAVTAYWPGLSGPFILDDFASIAALGKHGGVVDWQSFKAFVLGGNSGPTGRPVSLLTFLIDGTNWPTDAAPFKRTNLIIHLMIGGLLGILTKQILCLLRFESREARTLALVSAACWVLHPFLVSTTLYAVQRMAQLSTLFVIAGLIVYIHGRSFLLTNKSRAYLQMSLAVPTFTLLALLSKENGILLPVLIGVIEITVVASQRGRLGTISPYWSGLFIGLPTLVIAAYLGKQFFRPDFFDVVPPRDFSLYERLLTQSRILVDYLQNWFIPKLYTTGVYQDHFVKSIGILAPVTTIVMFVFHAFAIGLSVLYRRKQPLFGLAVLFFYGGHLLESTVLNLELYFEHRNYLSACFLFLPLILFLRRHTHKRFFVGIVFGFLLMLAGFTRYSATVWESVPSIVEASAHKAPTSARAQAEYSNILFNANRHEEALEVIERAIENRPDSDTLLQLNRLIILCNMNRLHLDELQKAIELVSTIPFDPRLLKAYNEFARVVKEGRCPAVPIDALQPMFTRMLDVPRNADPRSLAYSHIQYLVGYVAVFSGNPQQALAAFERSLGARAGASHAMAMAALMASGNYHEEALRLSDLALSYLADEEESMVIGTRVNRADIMEFRVTVQTDLENSRSLDRVDPAP